MPDEKQTMADTRRNFRPRKHHRARKALLFLATAAMACTCIWGTSFFTSGASYQQDLQRAIFSQDHDEVAFRGHNFSSFVHESPLDAEDTLNWDEFVNKIKDRDASQSSEDPGVSDSSFWGLGESVNAGASKITDIFNLKNIYEPPLYKESPHDLGGTIKPTAFTYLNVSVTFSSPFHPRDNDAYRQALADVPDEIIRSLGDKGWTIRVTDKAIEEEFPFVNITSDIANVAGLCWAPAKEIWILETVSPCVLIHEIGHAVDWESGGASIQDDWKEAISCVREASDYAASVRAAHEDTLFGSILATPICDDILARDRFFEQYATAFSYYWTNPDTLLMECPDMFYYFANHFGLHDIASGSDKTVEEALQAFYDEGERRRANPIVMDEKTVHDILDEEYKGATDPKHAKSGMAAYINAMEELKEFTEQVAVRNVANSVE